MSIGKDSSKKFSGKMSLDNVVYRAQLVFAWVVFKILRLHDASDNGERPIQATKVTPSEITVEIIPGGQPAR